MCVCVYMFYQGGSVSRSFTTRLCFLPRFMFEGITVKYAYFNKMSLSIHKRQYIRGPKIPVDTSSLCLCQFNSIQKALLE